MSFRLAGDARWASAGHEVAWADLELPVGVAGPAIEGVGAISATEQGDEIVVVGDAVRVHVSRTTGALSRYAFRGDELLAAPLRPSLWRAPTDNDVGNGLAS